MSERPILPSLFILDGMHWLTKYQHNLHAENCLDAEHSGHTCLSALLELAFWRQQHREEPCNIVLPTNDPEDESIPSDLRKSLELFASAVHFLDIDVFRVPAKDIRDTIATLASQSDRPVTIISPSKSYLGCLSKTCTFMHVSEKPLLWNQDMFYQHFGFTPSAFWTFQALAGSQSDGASAILQVKETQTLLQQNPDFADAFFAWRNTSCSPSHLTEIFQRIEDAFVRNHTLVWLDEDTELAEPIQGRWDSASLCQALEGDIPEEALRKLVSLET